MNQILNFLLIVNLFGISVPVWIRSTHSSQFCIETLLNSDSLTANNIGRDRFRKENSLQSLWFALHMSYKSMKVRARILSWNIRNNTWCGNLRDSRRQSWKCTSANGTGQCFSASVPRALKFSAPKSQCWHWKLALVLQKFWKGTGQWFSVPSVPNGDFLDKIAIFSKN